MEKRKERSASKGKRDSILANVSVSVRSDTLESRWESIFNSMRVAALTAYEGGKLTSLPEEYIQHLMQTFECLLRAPKDEIAMIPLSTPMPPPEMVFATILANAPLTQGPEGPEITMPIGLALLEHRRRMIDAAYRDAIAKEKSKYEGLGPGAPQKRYNELIVAARAKAARDAGISVADLRGNEKRPELLKKLCPWSKQFRIHEELIYPQILKAAGITSDELANADGDTLSTMQGQLKMARRAVEDEIRKAVVRFESRRYDRDLSRKQIGRRAELQKRASSARNKNK